MAQKTVTKKTQQYTTNNSQPIRFMLSTQMANNLLDDLRETLVVDFSDDSWWHASDLVVRLSTCVSTDTYHMIGELWRDMYTNPNLDYLDTSIKNIRTQINSENA